MGYGLTGFLAPDGEYYHSEYENHDETAKELIEKYSVSIGINDGNNLAMEGDFMKFGTYPWAKKEGCAGCHVFKNMNVPLTDKQRQWLLEHLEDMTDKQRNAVEKFLHWDSKKFPSQL